jgi:bifunctional DNA-binding transcriptional regulator/antitoxin component of YhaV-PrlF toxin-antitoxin module
MRFTTTLLLHGKSATGIEVPADVMAALGPGSRHPVSVTINGHTYRSTTASMGGRILLPVSAEVRANAGVAAGDDLDVLIERDEAPREVVVPADLAQALAAVPEAREAFDALSFSKRKEAVRSVEAAKTDVTRQRRIAKVVESAG